MPGQAVCWRPYTTGGLVGVARRAAPGDPSVIANVTRNAATLYRRAGRYDLADVGLLLSPLPHQLGGDRLVLGMLVVRQQSRELPQGLSEHGQDLTLVCVGLVLGDVTISHRELAAVVAHDRDVHTADGWCRAVAWTPVP